MSSEKKKKAKKTKTTRSKPASQSAKKASKKSAREAPQRVGDGGATEPLAGGANAHSSNGRLHVTAAILNRPKSDLPELFRFWADTGTPPPKDDAALRAAVIDRMSDAEVLAQRVGGLGRRQGAVLELLMEAQDYRLDYAALAGSKSVSYFSSYDLESCLTSLERHGLVVQAEDPRFESFGQSVYALPAEVGDGLLRYRRARQRGTFDILTLRGYLDRFYCDPSRSRRSPASRQREMYKMYARESAAVARIERLPDGIRELVEKAILEFGGVLPRTLFERMDTELPHWNGRRWRLILEKSLVGTVQHLDLTRYGIHHSDETLIVFNEVALAWLKHVAVPGDPDRPHEELSLGIDLTSNLSRFLGIIQSADVRFTVKGEIFKTTEKKILQQLIPNPGRELKREEVLGFIFHFARQNSLIDNTGERTFAVTSTGREWGQKNVADKLKELVQYSLTERNLGGEAYHQMRMREIFMRLLKRVEPGVWYDLMYLPFLARNTYLASMDDLRVQEYFDERAQAQHFTPMEDPQRMAWNLVKWVRQRLYLLGAVDLGYDERSRPVAMRLTHSGARLIGITDDTAPRDGLGNLVVTPDFEVVLFPTGDDAELVHDLDRFCVRERQGHLVHFRIGQQTVARALTEGMHLARILDTLERHSRTPVPQNVRFSVRDWAISAGLITLDEKLRAKAEDPETLRRFMQDAGVRPHLRTLIDDVTVQLKGRISQKRMQSLLRDLGFLVEPA